MSLPSMIATTALAIAGLSSTTSTEAVAESFIGRQTPTLVSDRMTPEALWAMGRIGTVAPILQEPTSFIRLAIIVYQRISRILCSICWTSKVRNRNS